MRRVLGSVACGMGMAMALGPGSAAVAAPITYRMVMNDVNGVLLGSGFSNQAVIMTFTGDTGNVSPWGNPSTPFGYYNNIAGGSITVQVGSGPVYTVTDTMSVQAHNVGSGSRIGFTKGGYPGTELFNFVPGGAYPGPIAVMTGNYTQSSSGLSVLSAFASNQLSITGGTFYLTSAPNPTGSFTSAVASAVPGAGLAAIGGVGLAGLTRRRRG